MRSARAASRSSWARRNWILMAACVAVGLAVTMPALADGPAIRPNEGRPDVLWKDAKNLIGQFAYVSGKVTDFYEAKSVYLLNVGDAQAKEFTIVIPNDHLGNFPKKPSLLYVNKPVRVYGMVTTYRGAPQIFAGYPEQIEVLDKLPDLPTYKAPPAITPTGEIKVATYNILNLFDERNDPYRNDEYTRTKPREELDRLARSFHELNADVIALEEVEDRGYLTRFRDVFLKDMGYEHVVLYEGNDLRGIDVCLLSRVPVGEVRTYRHQEFPDFEGNPMHMQRDLLCAEILPPGGKPFEVWVVHLKSKSGGADSDVLRVGEARFIRGKLDEKLKRDPEARIIVTGDFNDTWDSMSLKTIVGDGPTAMKCFFDPIPEKERISYNKEPYRSMIDFILCSQEMAKSYVKDSYKITPGTVDSSGSDHNPVQARFSLN